MAEIGADIETAEPRGSAAGHMHLVGGRLCLDFANTVDWRTGPNRQEWLNGYADLVAWGRHAGALTGAEADGMLAEARRHPAAAAAALARAIALREAIAAVFQAAACGTPPQAGDLAALNAALASALAHARVVPAGDGYAWAWAAGAGTLDRVLWPVARSAAELLTSPDLARVRECAGEPCGWLFLDTSRNRSRRWCTMEGCGNRAKARRHYARRRGAE
jgi:predicted RNA-binding Zn ribbon-like protein